jgi:hypothetical protein
MANIKTNEGELFRKTAADTVKSFNRVQAGKGSRWRTLPTDKYKNNFDEIDWGHDKHKKTTKEDEDR